MLKRNFLKSIQDWNPQRVLSVLGATGSGKTNLVLSYLRQNPELKKKTLLVSVDAVAVYEGLDIGSAKVMGEDRSDFRWCGIDLFSPSQKITSADFVRSVAPLMAEALENSRPVIVVGGSHFYERALLQGQSLGEESDPIFQKSLESCSNEELFERLKTQDSRWNQKLHLNDRYRLSRYLDLTERQKFSFDDLASPPQRHPLISNMNEEIDCMALGLDVEQEEFWHRLESRIAHMFEEGWVDEVKRLLKVYSPEAPGLKTVGYAELVLYLQGKLTLQESNELIAIAHRQLAKKQRTWLRGLLASK